MHYILLSVSPPRLVGPFDTKRAACDYGALWQEQNNDDPRWQFVRHDGSPLVPQPPVTPVQPAPEPPDTRVGRARFLDLIRRAHTALSHYENHMRDAAIASVQLENHYKELRRYLANQDNPEAVRQVLTVLVNNMLPPKQEDGEWTKHAFQTCSFFLHGLPDMHPAAASDPSA